MKKLLKSLLVLCALAMVSGPVSAEDQHGSVVFEVNHAVVGSSVIYGILLDFEIAPGAASIPINGALLTSGGTSPLDGTLLVYKDGTMYAHMNALMLSINMALLPDLTGYIGIYGPTGSQIDVAKVRLFQ